MSGTRFRSWNEQRLLTLDQVAEFFGISRDSVYARRGRDDFPPAVRIGGLLRWRLADVEEWLRDNTEGQP